MADTTTTTSMATWQQPYAQGYLDQQFKVSNTPYQGYGGETVAGFTPWQQQGLQAQAQRAADGSPVMGAAQQAITGVLNNGGGTNPYLQTQIDKAQGDVIRNWNQVQMPGFDTAMARGGSFGNANVTSMASQGASDLQRNLGDISNNMRYKDYSDGQNRMMTALGLAPQIAQQDYNDIDRLISAGKAYQGQNQAQMDDAYKRFIEQRDFPQTQLDRFGNAVAKINGGSTSTTSAPDPSRSAQAIGGALTFAQLIALLSGG